MRHVARANEDVQGGDAECKQRWQEAVGRRLCGDVLGVWHYEEVSYRNRQAKEESAAGWSGGRSCCRGHYERYCGQVIWWKCTSLQTVLCRLYVTMILCIQSEDLSVPDQTRRVQVKKPFQLLSFQTTFCAALCRTSPLLHLFQTAWSCHITLRSILVNECSLQSANLSLELLHLLPTIQRSPVVRLQA